jgi:hypothetical protein
MADWLLVPRQRGTAQQPSVASRPPRGRWWWCSRSASYSPALPATVACPVSIDDSILGGRAAQALVARRQFIVIWRHHGRDDSRTGEPSSLSQRSRCHTRLVGSRTAYFRPLRRSSGRRCAGNRRPGMAHSLYLAAGSGGQCDADGAGSVPAWLPRPGGGSGWRPGAASPRRRPRSIRSRSAHRVHQFRTEHRPPGALRHRAGLCRLRTSPGRAARPRHPGHPGSRHALFRHGRRRAGLRRRVPPGA